MLPLISLTDVDERLKKLALELYVLPAAKAKHFGMLLPSHICFYKRTYTAHVFTHKQNKR